jgi:hypothetical protein
MRRSWVLAAVALACCAAPAAAEPVALAPVTASVPIAAHGGWVVWSVPASGGWGLAAWHRGRVATLRVAPRPRPFDLDLGTDARGRTVATFSRCAEISTANPPLLPPTGEDCRVRVLDLATGHERAGGVPRPKDASDTMPSMWRGRIAFARHDPRHGDVAQLLLWSPSKHRLTTLRHGALPTACPYRTCKRLRVVGSVLSLDLGAELATFVWAVQAPGVVGHLGYELRADRLDDGRSVLAGFGYVGEACTSDPDGAAPFGAAAAGNAVWYALAASTCYVNSYSLVRFDARTRKAAFGALSGEILRFAKDRDALYALVAPKPQGEVAPTCDAPGEPCLIERIDRPVMTPRRFTPQSPLY